ncbi:unnamed protein product [Mytilus edulis]|uniref:DZIP3-like HEPN domain-containing protein n=1 Tax=Mytilus edulis TaxID=6550 RepID=A0A8S3SYV3_MYTED|nr:unnamed protein product [Mytilus edulis]
MADVLTGNGMQINVTSRGEENFLRIANLLLLIATPAVREKFNEEFHPARLETVLKENRFPHLDSLKQKNVINPIQWDLLFPVSGNTSSEDFDLTLMICLINNFTNISVSDKLPFDGDISSGADLSRLKYYRNKIMHSNCSTLTDRTFNKWWEEISEVVSRLGGAGFEERCNLLQKRRFAYGECYIPTEFENRTGVRDPVPKGLRS